MNLDATPIVSPANVYSATKKYPFHLSVGAVIRREDGKILCHYFDTLPDPLGHHDDVYILMRETVESGESMEEALIRGAAEEFGAAIKVDHILEAKIDQIRNDAKEFVWDKTTLYFVCSLIEIDVRERDENDFESDSDVQWHDPEFLIAHMKEQGKRTGRGDLDESRILELITK
jgi:ADP-ribose pyrophosphatase YjhB (NUDIX family)